MGTKEFRQQKSSGQDAGNEYARPVVVTQTIRGATVFASANADEHAWNADAHYFAVTGCTTFGFASDEHEYAWNADASGVTFGFAANTNEYAGHANAIGFAQPASFPSTKDGHEHADAVGESIGKSDGSNARHGHGWNEDEHGAVAGDERQ